LAKKKSAAPEQPPTPSYVVLRLAQSLIEKEKITLKELAKRVDMPPTSLAAMLAPTYQNMTLDRIDALKEVVREIRAGN
jgi:hypothetical protein